MAADVGRLLDALAVPPPYVLVGHSWGVWSRASRAQWRVAVRTARSEGAGIRRSLAEVRRDCPDLPAVPVHVLTAGGATGFNAKSVQRVHDAWVIAAVIGVLDVVEQQGGGA